MVRHPVDRGCVLALRVGPGGVNAFELRPLEGLGSELAGLGGSALALALVQESSATQLVFTLGEATRRGLPSTGRVQIAGRSPLTGGYTEGAVGGDLAWALVGLLDGSRGAPLAGLVIEADEDDLAGAASGVDQAGRVGRVAVATARGADRAGPSVSTDASCGAGGGMAVLELLGGREMWDLGAVSWRQLDVEQQALGAAELARSLVAAQEQRAGWVTAAVAAGPGARRGVPYGILVTGDETPVATGRGGLGTLLASLGIAALVVRAPERPRLNAGLLHRSLTGAAKQSPRLAERAMGGTLELFAAFAARGDLAGGPGQPALDGSEGRALLRAAKHAEVAHQGCKGCPTPCGLVFERSRGRRGGARFGATMALGPNLGFRGEAAFGAALELLEGCDAEGLDAREASACLALLASAAARSGAGSAPRLGDLPSLLAALGELPPMGSAELATELGLEAQSFATGGQAARPESDLAALLGQVVSSAGNDPMRSFPFLVARPGGSGPELPDGTPIPAEAFEPDSPIGKGRLVAWHEDLAAALDISGFCSFSAAGLLVDGVLDLDTLAGWIAPASLAQGPGIGRRFLAAGRQLVEARRALARRLVGAESIPAWAHESVTQPGMLDEYLAVRGEAGPGPVAESLRAPEPRAQPASAQPPGQRPGSKAQLGRVSLGMTGALAAALGASGPDANGVLDFTLELPATGLELLEALAQASPAAVRLLFGPGGRALPGLWRQRTPLGLDELVRAGEHVDLVLVIGGG